jgi:hypothetical protein
MWESFKYRVGFALVDVLDFIGEHCGWVAKSDYDRVVSAHLHMMKLLYDAELEIVRLRKKCGE